MTDNTYTNIPNRVIDMLLGTDLSRTAIKLYLLYRRYKNNENGKAWPSFRRICKEAHISSRDLAPARKELVDVGALHYEERSGTTTLVIFDDEGVFIVKSSSGLHREEQTALHGEESTITNTNTIKTTTNCGETSSSESFELEDELESKKSPPESSKELAESLKDNIISEPITRVSPGERVDIVQPSAVPSKTEFVNSETRNPLDLAREHNLKQIPILEASGTPRDLAMIEIIKKAYSVVPEALGTQIDR